MDADTRELSAFSFGTAGDRPIAIDNDADGRADLAVFRGSNNTLYRLNSSTGEFVTRQIGQNIDSQ
jgi:hypothetical protein